MTWDISTPTGSEAISNGDDRIRELKQDIGNALTAGEVTGTEAIFPGNDTANPKYRYRGLLGATASRPAAGQHGLYFDTTRNMLQRDDSVGWADIGTMIPPGTVMIFAQVSAPTGWTKLTTVNDRALRIVSGSTGGGTGGTAGLSGGITHTVASHTHSIAASGTHVHAFTTVSTRNNANADGSVGYPTAGAVNLGAWGASGGTQVNDIDFQGVAAGGDHTHGGTTGSAVPGTDTITLAYYDVIQASKG